MAKKHRKFLSYIFGNSSLKQEKMIGIDISPHYIRICNMYNEYGKWTLKSLASACMEKMYSFNDIFAHKEFYIEQLKSLILKNNIKIKDAAFSLPVSSAIVSTLSIPDMEKEELDKAVASGDVWQSMLSIPGNISDYSISYEIINRHKDKVRIQKQLGIVPIINLAGQTAQSAEQENPVENEETMDVLFVAIPNYITEIYAEIIAGAGLNPVLADLRCNAFNHALAINKQLKAEQGTNVFIEFGTDDNYIFIIDGEKLHLIPMPIDDEIKADLIRNIDNPEYFIQFANNFAEVTKQTLAGFSEQNPHKYIQNIYVSSSMPLYIKDNNNLPYVNLFIDNFSKILNKYSVSECSFCDHIRVPEKFNKKVNAEGKLSAWVASLGMATRKLDIFDTNPLPAAYNINLLANHEDKKVERRFRIASNMFSLAMIIVSILGCIGVYYITIVQKNGLEKNIKSLSTISIEYDNKDKKLNHLKLIISKVDTLNNVKGNLPSNQLQIIDCFKDIAESTPEGIWLTNMDFIAPGKIIITANAVDDQRILDFVSSLGKEKSFNKIALKTMKAVSKKSTANDNDIILKNFNIEIELLPVKIEKITAEKTNAIKS